MLTADHHRRRRRWTGFRRVVDLGDHLGAEGDMVLSRSGELSLRRSPTWLLTAKSLRPLPDKHRGISDPEARVRQRYLDLAVNPAARSRLIARSAAIRAVRDTLDDLRLPRGGDADPADHPRRRQRAAVPHPHQRLRPRPVPADRARALPEAADGRRDRQDLRDRPQLPQRGRRRDPQPRVHHARGVPGVRRLHHHARRGAGADHLRRAGGARAARSSAAPIITATGTRSTSPSRGR